MSNCGTMNTVCFYKIHRENVLVHLSCTTKYLEDLKDDKFCLIILNEIQNEMIKPFGFKI